MLLDIGRELCMGRPKSASPSEEGEVKDDEVSDVKVFATSFLKFSGYFPECSGSAGVAELENLRFPAFSCSACSFSRNLPATNPLALGPPRRRHQQYHGA